MRKVVITGVAGFLGSHLAKDLIDQGNEVIGIDNLYTGKKKNLTDLNKDKFTFINTDICSNELLKHPLLKNIHEIYHLACPASPKYYQARPLETINANTVGTINMLELAKQNRAKILYASTSEVYGDPEVSPQPETYRGNVNTWGPRACYDESKRMGEVFCYLYYSLYNVKVRVARIFNTYSAGLANDDGRVISNFVIQALTGKDITVYGSGEQTRSFCYVTDTIAGFKKMMENEKANGEIINIGNPTEYKIIEIAHLVKELTNSDSHIIFLPLPEDDPRQRKPNIQKAKMLLNWEPKVSIDEGLKQTINIYKEKLVN
ncbi:UDP-glucuronic acid decarboxylase family protein [Neobacillus sp. 179-C4.2 HS]|uniref:UDP-glucuronate decarboxylase n=1 Tax=Neobacillus driksii TaxID=3035913 RepID=A0ABV4YSP3_9BACI|nr:UDP-glucuronic acid decarboxylase family protein [Neobacillus sp. 179.-C4.2 HS]MDP5195482.1 SDR family oxidoreductase [Neobacillus sp. 179.-C4.2 HS]